MRKRSRRTRRHNYHRRYRRNSGGTGSVTLRRPLAALSAGFKPSALTTAAIMAGGAYLNMLVRDRITAMLPVGAQKLGSYVVGLATGGAMAAIPKVGTRMAAGALAGEAVRGIVQFVPGAKALAGMDEFAYDDDGRLRGMNEFATTRSLPMHGMNEFATVANLPKELTVSDMAGVDTNAASE